MVNPREIFDEKVQAIVEIMNRHFHEVSESLSKIDESSITSLEVIPDLYDSLNKMRNKLDGLTINFDVNSIGNIINKEYADKLKCYEADKDKIMVSLLHEVEQKIEDKKEQIRRRNEVIRENNKRVREEIDAANSRYRQLEAKRQSLLEYGSEILQICSDYGIKVSDINIDNNMFSIDELEVFYDQFNTFISSKYKVKSNPIRWIRDKFNDDSSILCGVLVLFLALCFTPLLDVFSIIGLLYILYNQSIQDSLVKKFTIMAGLAFNVNPMEIGVVKEVTDDMLIAELSEDINPDEDPDLSGLLNDVNKEMDNISDDDIKKEFTEATARFSMEYSSMVDEFDSVKSGLEKDKRKLLDELDNKISKIKEIESDLRSKVKLLGQEFTDSFVINTNVKLGLNTDTMVYETFDIGMKNILFKETGNDTNDLDAFIKVLIANFYCNVRPGYLDVTIYDPNGLGRSMAGFYDADMEQVFKISNESLDEIIKDMQQHTDKVIRMTKGMSINEYNMEAAKVGKTCLNYKLLVILSQPKTVEENEALRSFVEYSAELGVFVWIVSDTKFPNTKVFLSPFEDVRNPIRINRNEFPIEVMSNLKHAFKSLSSPALMWEDFKNVAIPDNKIWTYNADEFIQIDPGFEDGDPSKYKGYTLGNTGDIHSICVGGTGAGKSVFINNVIANVCTKYHPNNIELWLVDFKGSEFNFYLKNPEIGQNYMLPHIKACLCTSDPDYSVSLFKALRSEADNRYKFLMSEGFKNMYEFNKAMRKQNREEQCLKRTLVVVDEFQVIFEKTDGKAQNQLKKDITQIAKVARACGIHLMFCSQSMKGTMSDDILSQFTLRFGLRCPMDVSLAIMGTKYSGDIREKNGYLYVSSIDDKKKELQKRFRTPFIPDSSLRDRINMLASRAESSGYKRSEEAITYDERTVHNIEEMDSLYDTVLKGRDLNGLFVLGERMVYSDRGRRSNIILTRENNQHIYSVFSNTDDMVMFFNTIIHNTQRNGNNMMIYNSQVTDLGYLCHLDEIVDETNKFFYVEDQTPSTLIKVFNDLFDSRKQKNDVSSLKPLYIVCIGWDKSIGFGVNNNYRLAEQYTTLLQTCGQVNMHFIFITSSLGEVPRSIVMSCNYRICGKCDEKSSNTLLDSDAAYKNYEQDKGYMFVFTSGRVERVKIYRSELTREIQERELHI